MVIYFLNTGLLFQLFSSITQISHKKTTEKHTLSRVVYAWQGKTLQKTDKLRFKKYYSFFYKQDLDTLMSRELLEFWVKSACFTTCTATCMFLFNIPWPTRQEHTEEYKSNVYIRILLLSFKNQFGIVKTGSSFSHSKIQCLLVDVFGITGTSPCNRNVKLTSSKFSSKSHSSNCLGSKSVSCSARFISIFIFPLMALTLSWFSHHHGKQCVLLICLGKHKTLLDSITGRGFYIW